MKYKNNQFIYSPSDLSSHSSCKHLTKLNKQNARGEIADPEIYNNLVLKMLKEKGIEFEASHLQKLKDEGKTITEINNDQT